MNLATLILKTIEGATSRTKSIFGGTNAMSAIEVTEFINEYPVVLVSTVDIHGAPHVTGKAAVLIDSRTYFGAPEDTAMGRNLRRNPNVALAFAEPLWKRHVFMYGKVRFLEGGSDEEGLCPGCPPGDTRLRDVWPCRGAARKDIHLERVALSLRGEVPLLVRQMLI